jgi:prevent-host-death family protein
MTTMSVSKFRNNIRDVGNQVAYAGERVCIENHNKPYFAVISSEDLKLLQLLEDKIDLEKAREALKRNKFVSWEDVKKELGI